MHKSVPCRILCAGLLALAATTAGSLTAAEAPKPALLFIGKPQIYTEVAYLDELEKHGFDVEAAAWPEVTPHTLRRYNAIVITHFVDEGANVEAGGGTGDSGFGTTRQRFVDDYMKAGGGVLLFLNTVGCYGKGKLGSVPAWLKKYALDFHAEALSDPEREVLASEPSVRRYSQKYAWTESFTQHPITDGLKRVWFPTGWGGHVAGNAVPVTCGHQWEKLVQTGPGAKIIGPGHDVWADLYRQTFPTGPHTLLAVRKANNGRLAVLGLSPMWTVWSPYNPALGSAIMKTGEGGKPSDTWKLLENSYRWLAEPSLQMGIYGREIAKRPPVPGDTPVIPWGELTFPPAPAKFIRGSCGAHTAYSTGKGTVAEWVVAAKKAGFSFLIFAEDLAAMDAGKWKQLQADCKAATSAEFMAWPGIEYRNAAGTRGFMPLGYNDWFPKDWLTDDGKAVNIDRGWSPAKGWGAKTGHSSGQIMAFLTWWHNGYFDFARNPTPPWDHKLYCFFPVWSSERKQPLDNALEPYLQAAAAHVNPAAYALDLTYEPADLAEAITGGRPHLAVCAEADPRFPDEPTLANVFGRLVVNTVKDGLGAGCYRGWTGPVATQGPTLRWMFRGGYQWEGVEFPRYWIERHAGPQDKDWTMASWYRLKLRLDAQSDAGIREVVIHDGDRGVFRRFDAKGAKTFGAEFDVVQCPTRHLVAVVTDVNGRQAVSREIWLEQQMGLYNYCGDRVNAPGSVFQPIHGHPYLVDTGKKLYEVRRFFADLVSPDILIERFSSDAVYKFEELSDEFGWHNWAPHHPRDDYTITQSAYAWYQGHGRQVSYASHPSQGVYWDGFTPVEKVAPGKLAAPQLKIMESTMTFLKAPELDADGFVPRTVTTWELPLTAEEPGFLRIGDGKSWLLPSGGLSLRESTQKEMTLTFTDAMSKVVQLGPREGSAAGRTLLWSGSSPTSKHVIKDDKIVLKIGYRPGQDAGAVPAPFAWRTEEINRRVDLDQLKKPSWFKIKTGELQDQPLCELRIAARDGVAVVAVERAALDSNSQPLVVAGVSDRQTALLYEKESRTLRPIGVWGGKAYVQIPATRKDVTLVIGNLVRASHPEVRVEAMQETDDAGKPTGRWLIDAHNPSAAAVDVQFNVPPAFDFIRKRVHSATLPAGASVPFTLE